MNYKASIVQELFTMIQKKPNHTMGELVQDIKSKLKGVPFLKATDEQFYTAVEEAINDSEDDVKMSDEEFEDWINKK